MWMALALPVVELVEEVFLNTPGVCLRKQVAEDGSRELHDVPVARLRGVRVTIAVESTDSGEDLVEVSNLRGAWTSTGSLPEPLQGYIRSCQLLLAPM
ncbi:hypothetical protein CDL15_Pgr000896 [Punica granatum]|uniref:Uncharacterized protein n=1 Tax=Punica granatum TaxID=22663 RepID=A0A218XIB4_PUNGR|nr:hypothetical protein CDL15_Pgr000896 [Punica granatum]